MTTVNAPFQNSKKNKLLFYLSVFTSLFYILTNYLPVYRYAFLGALFEFLWLPMIVLLFALPIVCIISWYKEKFHSKSLNPYSLLVLFATYTWLIYHFYISPAFNT